MRIQRLLPALAALLLALFSLACSSGGGTTPSPSVAVLAPAADVEGDPGVEVEIRFAVSGVDSALVDVVAKVLYGGGEDLVLASDLPTTGGAEQELLWDTSGSQIGVYRIEVRASAKGKSGAAQAPGLVRLGTLNPPPGLVTIEGEGVFLYPSSLASSADGALVTLLRTTSFGAELTFGAGGAEETTLVPGANVADMFVARYAPDGEFLWVQHTRSPSSMPLTPDDGGFVGGKLAYTATPCGAVSQNDGSTLVLANALGPVRFGDTLVQADQQTGTLVLWSLDSDGETAWLRTLEPVPAGEAFQQRIAALPEGRVAIKTPIQGGQNQTLVLGQGEANQTEIVQSDVAGDVLAVYEPDGSLAWAQAFPRRAGGNRGARIEAMAADAGGDLLVCGWFYGAVIFGKPGPSEEPLTAPGDEQRVFLARVDPEGELLWVRTASSPDTMFTWPRELAVAPSGSVAMLAVRYYAGALTFDAGLNTETVLGAGGDGGTQFLIQFDGDGHVEWAKDTGLVDSLSAQNYHAGGLLPAAGGDWIVVDGFEDPDELGTTLTIDPDGLAPTQLAVAPDSIQLVLARFGADGELVWARLDGATEGNVLGISGATRAGGAFTVLAVLSGVAEFGQGNEHTISTSEADVAALATWGPTGELLATPD